MNIIKTKLTDAYIIEPDIHPDNRGYFFESYSKIKLQDVFAGEFVQDNQSLSCTKGVIRGLHCQAGEHSQSKLVRVVSGSVTDFIVDARKGSPSYLKWISVELTGENQRQLFIPKGFLHGFVTNTDEVLFCYKVDEYYCKESERGVFYADPLFGIDWGVKNPILSAKDQVNPLFKEAQVDFTYKAK